MDIRQQRTVIPEGGETNDVTPVAGRKLLLESFQASALGRGAPAESVWPSEPRRPPSLWTVSLEKPCAVYGRKELHRVSELRRRTEGAFSALISTEKYRGWGEKHLKGVEGVLVLRAWEGENQLILQVIQLYRRTKLKHIYMNTGVSSTSQGKTNSVWHPIKNYQPCDEARKCDSYWG